MLTENEETIAVNMLLLHDNLKQYNKPEVVIEDMVEAERELTGFINSMWDSLTEREKNQVLDRYTEEKKLSFNREA